MTSAPTTPDQSSAQAAATAHADPGAAMTAPPPPEPMRALQVFLTALLQTQCSLVGGLAGAVFLASGAKRRAGLAAQFEPSVAEPLLAPALLSRAERLAGELFASDQPITRVEVVQAARGKSMYAEEPRHRLLAAPLLADGRIEGACVILAPRAGLTDAEALKLIALSVAQFEAFLWRQQCLTEAEQKLMLRQTLELLDALQQGPDAGAMGAIFCEELKRRFGCTRVSVGLVKGHFIRLVAVTNADEVDRNAPAIEAIEAAMEECAVQDSEIMFPVLVEHADDPAKRRVTRAHETLSRRYGPTSALSLPLRVDGDLVGVAVLERDASDPFPAAALPLLRLVAETVGPALWTRRLADRGIWRVTLDQARAAAEGIVGPRHTARKVIALTVLLFLVGGFAIPIPSRVIATAEVRAVTARAVAPPFVGYLQSVAVKPGDEVKLNQVLAEMDTSDLRRQLIESDARRATFEAERDDALAKGDMAKVRALDTQAQEAQAQSLMLMDHINRSVIRSPIDGVVGRGDLEAFVGARVEPSQPMFEIVSVDNRAIAYVDERDVQRLEAGRPGTLAIKARPGERIDLVVDRINPVAEVVKGKNVYPVDVLLAADKPAPGWLRPGMSGIIRLEDGYTTPLVSILRPLLDEARMRLWW